MASTTETVLDALWNRVKPLRQLLGLGGLAVVVVSLAIGPYNVISDHLVWPSEWIQSRKADRIEEYRLEAAKQLWIAGNMTFHGDVPDVLRQSIRQVHLDQAVLMNLRANRLETGRLVDVPLPAKWIEKVWYYPTLELPNSLKSDEEGTREEPPSRAEN